MSRIRSFVISTVSIAMLGVFALPGIARAASVVVIVTDGTAAVAGAFVAAVDTTTKAAVDAVVSGTDGKATLDVGSAALASLKVIVSKQGFDTATATTVAAETAVTMKASTSSSLKFANVFGAQTKSIVADAESGVFYSTTDGQPSVWRTTDYAGTWAAVPTTADASTGLPQQQAQKVVTSGSAGEVAVTLRNGLWYSRDYGTTWKSLDTQVGFNNVWWVHAGTSSYLFAQTGAVMKVAVMSVESPSLADWSVPGAESLAATDVWTFAQGSQASKQVYAAAAPRDGATSVKVFKLAQGATSAAEVSVSSRITTSGLVFSNTNQSDILMISTLGGADLAAVVVYDKEGTGNASTGTLRAGYTSDGGATPGGWTYSVGSNAIMGPGAGGGGGINFDGFTGWKSYDKLSSADGSFCGENETPPVGSIAPVSPSSSGYADFKIVGTIRSCMFAFNTNVASKPWAGLAGTADVPAGKFAVMPMNGANNNTGFAFDGGFDFSSNWVVLTGDGQYGIRKSAAAFDTPSYRPTFGQAGGGVANDFILHQAKAGPGADSGGISVNGIVAPAVQDIAMSPNVTDGSTYLVSTNPSGGSRTMLTTDGGKSFSTLNSAGSTQLDWWNGAGGKQWIMGGAPLDQKRYFRIKTFTTATGTAATQMGEELAATAAQRDSTTDQSLRFTTNSTELRPLSATCYGLDQFISTGSGCAGGQTDMSQGVISMTGLAGVVGTDKVLVAVSRGMPGQEGITPYGTVALLTLAANPSDDGATVSDIKYFGSAVAQGGTATDATSKFDVNAIGTYGGVVTNVAYCPTGSAPQVADKAFIAVWGKGVYVMTGVSTSPSHNNTPVSTTSFKDLKADCDTGLLVGASSTGPMLSFDGASFVGIKSGPTGESTTVDVQANKTNGDVSILTASGGNVKEIDTSFSQMGLTADAVASGTVKTPALPPVLPDSTSTTLNDSTSGRDVGQVADVEFSTETGDVVTKASVSTASVHAAGVTAFAAADRKSQIASSSGAYSASLAQQTLSTLLPGGTPTATPTPGATTTPGTTGTTTGGTSTSVASKVSLVKKGKTIPLASAVKKAGGTIPVKSKVVVSQTAASKKICKVIGVTKIQGLKAGTCAITVKITPPKSVKVKKPTTVTVKLSVSVT